MRMELVNSCKVANTCRLGDVLGKELYTDDISKVWYMMDGIEVLYLGYTFG